MPFKPRYRGNAIRQDFKFLFQVVIQGLTGSTLNALLDFIYTGSICVTQENVQELLIGSDMIQLQEVVDICTQYLLDQVTYYLIHGKPKLNWNGIAAITHLTTRKRTCVWP